MLAVICWLSVGMYFAWTGLESFRGKPYIGPKLDTLGHKARRIYLPDSPEKRGLGAAFLTLGSGLIIASIYLTLNINEPKLIGATFCLWIFVLVTFPFITYIYQREKNKKHKRKGNHKSH